MPDLEQAQTTQQRSQPEGRYFIRFTREQRYLHAVLFSTFLGLAATGLPLRFSESFWARGSQRVGGFGAILFFHKFCAVVLTIAFLIHVKESFTRDLSSRKGNLLGITSMVANWKDVKDLFGHMRWFLGLGPKPQFERYAYWEKFDYWAVFWGMIVIGFSGYAMWFAPSSPLPARLGAQCRARHSQRRGPARHPLHLLHSLRQHPPSPRQLSHGHGDLYRRRERRRVQAQAAARIRAAASAKASSNRDSAPHRRRWLINFSKSRRVPSPSSSASRFWCSH